MSGHCPAYHVESRVAHIFPRSNGDDHKLLKISYIISRRTSIDIFQGQQTKVGEFINTIIKGFSEGGKVMDTIGNLAAGVIEKLFGSSSGSAQTERV